MYNSTFRLILGDRDMTGLADTVTLSGTLRQCARTLTFGIPALWLDTAIGARALLYVDGKLLFDGSVVNRATSTSSPTVKLRCFDRGFYLNRNEAALAVRNQTPEAVTRALCADFGIACGELARTGIPLSRNFLPSSGGANTLYRIISTLYTLASRYTGDKYVVRFEGDKLCVRVRSLREYTLALSPDAGLLSADCTESIEGTVSRVLVYDSADTLLCIREAGDLVNAYGVLQAVRKAGDGEDPESVASEVLRENGVSQTVAVTNLGNTDCITGGTVLIREPSTGLDGVFWIDEDYHYWKGGIYTNRLVLNYQCLMNEANAGSDS